MRFLFLLVFVGIIFLTGCEVEPEPTALPLTPTSTFPAPTMPPFPTATPEFTPAFTTPGPTPTLTPTPTPTQTPTPPPTPFQEKEYVLGLINEAREEHGVLPVELGTNSAAQGHAEAMLKGNFIGHWGLDGLNPNMRYTLAGGTNHVMENTGGDVLTPGVNYTRRTRKTILTEVHTGLMNSSGHRKNIVNKWHTTVNLGIACNEVTCSIVQNFEGDYVTFSKEPMISNGTLSFAGALEGGFTFNNVQVWYDQPPHPLTLGQLDATYSYLVGQELATFLLKPAPPGFHWSATDLLPTSHNWTAGVDPYTVDPKQPRIARSKSGVPLPRLILPLPKTAVVPWTVAETLELSGSAFEVKADISEVIGKRGPGVYTVVIWGDNAGELIPLTNYSVVVGTQPP